ncbi:MAG TPA: hypothetical protein VHI13_06915 [Candidatus Kapabacteria bacterium]|nr:hypothetical protein [Candidatus Kapabacteria bacterium]
MRYALMVLLIVCVAATAKAQQERSDMTATYPGFALIYHDGAGTGAAGPSILSRVDQGSGDRFGLILHADAAAARAIEILGDRGVRKEITASDLAGQSSDGSVTLLASDVNLPGRYVRHMYDVRMSGGGNLRLVTKVLATGDAAGAHPFLVSYSLAGSNAEKLALRITLPFQGSAEARPDGFVIASKSDPAAMAGVVLPRPQGVAIVANSIAITGRSTELQSGGRETPMLWLQIDGAGGATPAAARAAAVAMLGDAAAATSGPNIIVVSATDRPNVNPHDTVSMTLIYVNVGTQSASGVMLRNPVPAGTQYLASSAEGDGMRVEYDRSAENDGEIRAVRWTMNGELRPGEERIARFKTVVR